MWYEETKIYHDGSHYIAIPHTTNPRPRRPRPKETEIEVVEEIEPPQQNMIVPEIGMPVVGRKMRPVEKLSNR
ncbi:MAG: hypothetical protein ACLRSW_15910 [Christensenellaceae bacterium]